MMGKRTEVQPGDKFGRWTVVSSELERGSKNRLYAKCICACGVEKSVRADRLVGGDSGSCGCLRVEVATALFKGNTYSRTHGCSRSGLGTLEYSSWSSMRSRCCNPNAPDFHRYGGRGIKIDDRWAEFTNFLSDMGLRPTKSHTIERLDNNGDYTPRNCAWATPKEQSANQKRTCFVEYDGKRVTLSSLTDTCGLAHTTVAQRVRRGWEIKRALSTPARKITPRRKRQCETQTTTS